MGKIALCRVDYRLAHGQVAFTWVTSLNAKKIVIIDEETSKDKLALGIMQAGMRGTKVVAYSIDRGVEEYQKDKFGPGNIIVIFRNIKNAYEAYQKGFDFSHLNVAQVPMAEGRRHAVATINLSDEEMGILTKLHDCGVDVYNHQTITDVKNSYESILKSMM
ncbi:MAG: PTS sugar transporter subunit IIB [Oscillospiraceae bacterium]|nr:PTS sugar transporter subunit IIB [Oscillospiraceae bacterium]